MPHILQGPRLRRPRGEDRRVAVPRASSAKARWKGRPTPESERGSGHLRTMTMGTMRTAAAVTLALVLGAPSLAHAQANCRNTGAFEPWLAAFKKEAAAKGISPAAIAEASPYMVLDQRIINIDRGQKFFAQNF